MIRKVIAYRVAGTATQLSANNEAMECNDILVNNSPARFSTIFLTMCGSTSSGLRVGEPGQMNDVRDGVSCTYNNRASRIKNDAAKVALM